MSDESERPVGRAVDPDGAWYLVTHDTGEPAVMLSGQRKMAICCPIRITATEFVRRSSAQPGPKLTVTPVYPEDSKRLQEVLGGLGVDCVAWAFGVKQTEKGFAVGDIIDGEACNAAALPTREMIEMFVDLPRALKRGELR